MDTIAPDVAIYNLYRIDFVDNKTKGYVARTDSEALQIAELDRPGVERRQISLVRRNIGHDCAPGPAPVPPLELLAMLASDGWYGPIEVDEETGEYIAHSQAGKDVARFAAGGGGISNYNALDNKPQIESVTLEGDKSAADLGLAKPDDITSAVSNHNTSSVAHADIRELINAEVTRATAAESALALPDTAALSTTKEYALSIRYDSVNNVWDTYWVEVVE